MHTSFKITEDMQKRIENLLTGSKTISQFAYEATEEKVKRMEARDERARIQLAAKDKAILEPIMQDILKGWGIME